MTTLAMLWPLLLALLVGGLSAPSLAAGNEPGATFHFATLAPSPGKCPYESSATEAFTKGVADQFPSPPLSTRSATEMRPTCPERSMTCFE